MIPNPHQDLSMEPRDCCRTSVFAAFFFLSFTIFLWFGLDLRASIGMFLGDAWQSTLPGAVPRAGSSASSRYFVSLRKVTRGSHMEEAYAQMQQIPEIYGMAGPKHALRYTQAPSLAKFMVTLWTVHALLRLHRRR